jgi:hypothetical protein
LYDIRLDPHEYFWGYRSQCEHFHHNPITTSRSVAAGEATPEAAAAKKTSDDAA